MDTLAPSPPIRALRPSVSRPPRRRRWPWVLALLLAGATVWSGAFVANYEPLVGDGTGAWWVEPASARQIGEFSSPRGEAFEVYAVTYRDGERFRYGFSIYNEGRFPVRVTSVGGEPFEDMIDPLEEIRTLLTPASGPNRDDPDHAAPFSPFTLAPGHHRFVIIEARFRHCPKVTHRYGSEPVTFELFRMPRHTTVYLPYTLEVTGHAPCP